MANTGPSIESSRPWLVSLFLLAAGASRAAAADRTWNGPDGGNWSVAANWLPVGTPQPTDDLIFPLALSGTAINANGATYTVNSLTFQGGYNVNGDGAIEVGAGGVTIDSAPWPFVFHVPITLTADQVWTIDCLVFQIDQIHLGANQWTATLAAGTESNVYYVSGSGAIIKNGAGLMRLRSNGSSHTGPFTIDDGVLRAENGAQLGDTDGTQAKGTTVNAPGVFEYIGTDPLPEALFLNGGGAVVLETTSSGVLFTGPVTLLSTSGISSRTRRSARVRAGDCRPRRARDRRRHGRRAQRAGAQQFPGSAVLRRSRRCAADGDTESTQSDGDREPAGERRHWNWPATPRRSAASTAPAGDARAQRHLPGADDQQRDAADLHRHDRRLGPPAQAGRG